MLSVMLAPRAQAQSKKELVAQNLALQQRIERLEARLLTGDPAAERLMQRMDALEAAQRTQTGEVERLRFERDNLRAEVAALSQDIRALQDLSTRMQIHLDAVDQVAREQNEARQNALNATLGQAVPASPNQSLSGQPSAVPSAPVMKEATLGVQDSFPDVAALPSQGRQKLAEGDFTGAKTAFEQYLLLTPDAPDAGEVSYWLGETHFVEGGYGEAAQAYVQSMRQAPQGVKAPDAMIKLAAVLRELGNKTEACQTLDSFPAQFPNAPAASRQKAQLEIARTGC